MNKWLLKTGTEKQFFETGKLIARQADQGTPILKNFVVSFEEAGEVARLLTAARIALFRSVREQPGSITDIAMRLHRDRSAVKRDIDALASAGLLAVTDCVFPGHGRMKQISAVAQTVTIKAELK